MLIHSQSFLLSLCRSVKWLLWLNVSVIRALLYPRVHCLGLYLNYVLYQYFSSLGSGFHLHLLTAYYIKHHIQSISFINVLSSKILAFWIFSKNSFGVFQAFWIVVSLDWLTKIDWFYLFIVWLSDWLIDWWGVNPPWLFMASCATLSKMGPCDCHLASWSEVLGHFCCLFHDS